MTGASPGARTGGRSLSALLLVTTPIRILLNTTFRMVYPFLPAFSRGLGVPVETLTLLLALRSGLGLSAPLFGLVPDRFGRRFAMTAGLLLFTLSLALAAAFPSLITFVAALFGVSLAKLLFDPALLAYLGDSTPYARRGLVMALSELGWSGATLVGIPLLGLLLAGGNWRAPFLPLALLGGLAAFGLWRVIPAGSAPAPGRTRALFAGVAGLFRHPVLLGAMGMGLLISLANEMLNVAYGLWMEGTFQLRIEALGASVIVIGLAELAGEGAVALLSDRLGKRRLVLLAGGLSALAYLLLPFIPGRLDLALAGVFLAYFSFETTIVGTLPLVSELHPEARGTLLSTNFLFMALGRMAGATLGGALFSLGFAWVGGLAALLNGLMLVLLWRVVRERAEPAPG
ncbi:MAG: MFS transporter [Anaerolineales bacterium]|nr:MFS transporter [Anaerolineales bacterium]